MQPYRPQHKWRPFKEDLAGKAQPHCFGNYRDNCSHCLGPCTWADRCKWQKWKTTVISNGDNERTEQ